MYLATTWQKSNAGNFVFGEVTYVINPSYSSKFFVSPWDTGACLVLGPWSLVPGP